MSILLNQRLNETLSLLQELNTSNIHVEVDRACELLVGALSKRLPVLVCGNGGSSSDAQHIAGELVGRFLVERAACNVIALSANTSVLTAWSNDYEYETVFSRQVEAHGQEGGVLWAISTSGNSKNVIRSIEVAKSMGIKTIGMTGAGGGKMANICDVLISVPTNLTPRIQELHIVLYHFICEQVEQALIKHHQG